MDRRQRIALARVISDLIEADFIVDEGEMDCFEQIISADGYRISREMLVEGKRMNLAKALATLAELDEGDRARLVDNLRRLALSDGMCVPLEAILVYAISQALANGAKVYAVPCKDVGIRNMQVLFIENETGSEADRQIKSHYASISSMFAKAGFSFVYIPRIADDFNRLDKAYLSKVVRYMIPSADDDKVARICHKLSNITTKQFCRDLLYKKIGINLIDAAPSLLVKVGDSGIIGQYGNDDAERTTYINFLRIELGADVVETIQSFLRSYAQMVSRPIEAESRPRTDKFLYYGFHRSLFDLIAFGRELRECKLVFDVSRAHYAVYFQSIDDGPEEKVPLKLNPQETALFALIATKSEAGEGLIWRDLHGAEKDRELEEYNSIYRNIGRGCATTYLAKDRSQIHNIRTKVKALGCVANADMFMPANHKDGQGASYYSIKAPKEYVEIHRV